MYFSHKISKELKADVAVIGGGTAGVFAAISAARCGAKTVLVEKNSFLGGTMISAGVNYPGLFFAWGKRIIGGPCWEAIERTVALGGATIPEISFSPKCHWHEQIRVNQFVYATVLFQMCEEAGVEVITNAMLSCASEREDSVDLVITDKDGMSSVKASVAIDATGDATLCRFLGYGMMKSSTQQPATLQNHISGYTVDKDVLERVEKAFADAELPERITASNLNWYLKIEKIDMHTQCVDADTASGRTRVDKDALFDLMKVVSFFRKIKGLENLRVDWVAFEAGVRETCRIEGKHVVTAEEYISGYNYPDSVCYAFYPIDLHIEKGIEQKFHKENVVSKIPYRALIPKKSRRVLCVGRCVSSDTYANSALRVQAPCMAMGQAAGVAASVMLKENKAAADIDYQSLRLALCSIGAIVPEENRDNKKIFEEVASS